MKYVAKYDSQKVFDIVNDMKKYGIRPDLLCFNIVMTVSSRLGRDEDFYYYWRKAQSLFFPEEITYNILISHLGRKGNFNQIDGVLKEMKNYKISPSIKTYNYILRYLYKSKKINEMIYYLREIQSNNLKPTDFTNYSILRIFSEQDLMGNVFSYLSYLKSKDIQLNKSHYSIILLNMGRFQRFEEMKKILEMINKLSIFPRSHLCEILTRSYFLGGDLTNGFKYLKELKKLLCPISKTTHNIILNSLSKEGKIDSVISYFSEFENADIISYNTMLNALGKRGKIQLLFKVYEKMKLNKLPIDQTSFNTIIDALGRYGSFDQMNQMIQEMKDNNIFLDSFSHSAIINSYGKHERILELLNYIEQLNEKSNVQFNDILYSSIINALGKVGNFKLVQFYIEKMKSDKIPLSLQIYNIIISNYGKFAKYSEMMDYYREMQENQISPDEYTFSIILTSYSKDFQNQQLLKVFQQIKTKYNCTFRVYNSVLSSLLKDFNKEKLTIVLELFEEMKEKKIKLDVSTFNIIIVAFSKSKKIDEMLKIYDEMIKLYNIFPDSYTFSEIIFCLVREKRKIETEKFLSQLNSTNIIFNVQLYNCLLSCYTFLENYDLVFSTFDEMKQVNKLNIHTFTLLSTSYGRMNRPDLLDTIELQLNEFSISPDIVFYTQLMGAYLDCKKIKKAIQIFYKVDKFFQWNTYITNLFLERLDMLLLPLPLQQSYICLKENISRKEFIGFLQLLQKELKD